MVHSSRVVSRFSIRVEHSLRLSNPYGGHQHWPLAEFGAGCKAWVCVSEVSDRIQRSGTKVWVYVLGVVCA
jgi:hypothetical protein